MHYEWAALVDEVSYSTPAQPARRDRVAGLRRYDIRHHEDAQRDHAKKHVGSQ